MGRVQCAKHNMCGHRHRQVRQRSKGGKIGPFQLPFRGIDHRKPEMSVRGGAPMPGNVLEDRQNAPCSSPPSRARPIAATLSALVP